MVRVSLTLVYNVWSPNSGLVTSKCWKCANPISIQGHVFIIIISRHKTSGNKRKSRFSTLSHYHFGLDFSEYKLAILLFMNELNVKL